MSRDRKASRADASRLLACDAKTLRRVYEKFDPDYLSDAVLALEGVV